MVKWRWWEMSKRRSGSPCRISCCEVAGACAWDLRVRQACHVEWSRPSRCHSCPRPGRVNIVPSQSHTPASSAYTVSHPPLQQSHVLTGVRDYVYTAVFIMAQVSTLTCTLESRQRGWNILLRSRGRGFCAACVQTSTQVVETVVQYTVVSYWKFIVFL